MKTIVMPSKSANTSGCTGSGSTYNTRQAVSGHFNGRRVAAPRAQVAQDGAVADDGDKTTVVYQKLRICDTRSSARDHPPEEDTRLPRVLNASSPAFVPKHYLHTQQQQQQQGDHAVESISATATQGALSFSAVTSPLLYMGSATGGSSFSSPLVFTDFSSTDRPTTMPTSISCASVLKVDPLSTGATYALSAASGSALSTQSSHQLRGAYARATAAAVAAAASTAPQSQRNDPFVSVAAAATSAIAEGPSTAPPRNHLELKSCRSLRGAPVEASPSFNAVYGPSVSVFHPQFVDITTGATSMTPFALLRDQITGKDSSDPFSEALDDGRATNGAAGESLTSPDTASVPLSPSTEALDNKDGEIQRVHQASVSANQQPSQRRVTAVTAAVLASHDAQLLERSKRHTEAIQRSRDTAFAKVVSAIVSPTHGTSSSQVPTHTDTSETTTTANATARYPYPVHAPTMTTAGDTETSTHQTPKRRPLRASTATTVTGDSNRVRASITPVTECGTSTVRRLHACLSSAEDRGERNPIGSVMGLTGSTRRGVPSCGDDDDHNGGRRSDTVTPTVTPAKVLAAEGSPFVAAAASSGDVSSLCGRRRSLSQEDNAAAHTESESVAATHHARVAHQQHGGDTHIECTVTQLVSQVHHCNGHNTKAQASSVVTPQRYSIHNAVSGETGATAAVPATFKTPDVERVPSSRPSASKNITSRNITTIIRTPSATGAHHGGSYTITKTIISETSRHHDSAADTGAPGKGSRSSAPRGVKRSLASCLESMAPQREESKFSSVNGVDAKVANTITHASLLSTSSESAVSAGAMTVPRSQRRGVKQGSASNTSATANEAAACIATDGVAASHSPAAQLASYAVVIEGHMKRRVTAVSPTVLKEGVCVLFKEDRGIDMGRVVQCSLLDGDEAAGIMATMASATSPLGRKDRPAPVLRIATSEEEYRWLHTDVKEAEATLEPCREAITRLGLPVNVVAAVYQFNKAKLTLYYESATRVDFRPLLPSLFSRFHCRIWMARLETPEAAEVVGSSGFEDGVPTRS